MKYRVAIIGGGASACLILANLARLSTKGSLRPLTIQIYDGQGIFALGKAYSTRNKRHLLNVRAADMGGYADDSGDFLKWLSVNHPEYGAEDFVPRLIYGAYLKDLWHDAIHVLQEGGHSIDTVARYVETVDDIDQADFIINATGNKRMQRSQNNALDAYNTDYSPAASWKKVIICGSGLSMVDAVLSLQEAGFKGQVDCISRHGFMPLSHATGRVAKIGLDWFDQTKATKITDLFFQIRRKARQIKKQGGQWQSVINSLRPITNKLWLNMLATERQKFIRRLMPYWNIHRHRIAAQIHQEITAMNKSGRLNLIRDSVEAIEQSESMWRVKGQHGSYHGDMVIDCMGYRVGQAPVVGEQQKLSFDAQMGPVNWPELFETVAIPEICQQANNVAQQIASKGAQICK